MLLDENFNGDPQQHGWALAGPEDDRDPTPAGSTAAVAHKGQRWISPPYPLQPQAWYRVEVRSRGAVDGGMNFTYLTGGDGTPIDAGHYEALPASDDWTEHVWYMRGHEDAAQGRMELSMPNDGRVEIDRVRVSPASAEAAAAWADEVYAKIPPVRPKLQADRLDRLPRTKAVLAEGGQLRVLFLGDSIANDTASSPFDALIERERPGVQMDVIVSVRGGTGCWWYRSRGRVREYVLRHRPDLVIIAGISHRLNAEAMEDVVSQIRKGTDAELLLMTGAVSDDHTTLIGRWVRGGTIEQQTERLRAFREEQVPAIADRHGAAFFPMRTVWDAYVAGSGWQPQQFRRDHIHAGTPGRQALARILLAYFTEGLPDMK